MAIHRKAKATDAKEAATEAFLTGAPDAGAKAEKPAPYEKGLPKGHKRQISITIAPELLRKVDERANAMGTGRSAFISMAIFKALSE
ncbi:ribbon-helix-helix domain-containing protein [Klebsiella aerogenes]